MIKQNVVGLKKLNAGTLNSSCSVRLRKKVLIPASFLLVVFLLIEIWAVNRLSSYGDRLNQIKNSQARLELENQILENKIAQKSALSYIEQYSVSLGFGQAKSVEYLNFPEVANAK